MTTTVARVFETWWGPPRVSGPAQAWLEAHGRLRALHRRAVGRGTEGRTFEVVNPATTERLAHVTQGGAADVDAAVRAARAAFPAWAGLSDHARARHLYALARAVQKHARLLAVLETLDGGKPIRESRDLDIPLVAAHFFYHAGWASFARAGCPVTSG
jgi:aldehyde dehydrogenase (NAD+)